MSNEMTNERMTCQICGRKILAKKGVIAHHGYQRPGDGEQTRSCPGARVSPLEVSNRVLAAHVAGIEKNVERLSDHVHAPISEIVQIKKRHCSKTWAMTTDRLVFTAENYSEMLAKHNRHAEYPPHFSMDEAKAVWEARYGVGTFDEHPESYRVARSMEGRERLRRVRVLELETDYCKMQSARLNASIETLGGVK